MNGRLSLSIAGLVLSLGSGAGALQGEGSTTNPASALSSASKSELGFFKNNLKSRLTTYCDTLDQIAADVEAGTITPDVALDQITQATSAFLDDMSDFANQVSRNLESFASSLLQGTTGFPAGFLLGDCGTIDRFSASIGKDVSKTVSRVLKKLKKVSQALRGAGYAMNPSVAAPAPAPPPAPNPGPPAPPPAKPLTMNALAGGSDVTQANDGKLCVGGTADPANGNVDVTITGPGGASFNQMVAVDPVTCRWMACFPPAGPPNLPEGNYKVEASQGGGNGASVNGAIGVPGAP